MRISNKTQFGFEPVATADATATGVQHTTDTAWAVKLGSLAAWTIKTCQWKYKVALNQATAAGAATLNLKAGGTVVGTVAVDLTAGDAVGVVEIDLAGIEGQTRIVMELDVTTAADAGTVAEIAGALDIETPLIVSGC